MNKHLETHSTNEQDNHFPLTINQMQAHAAFKRNTCQIDQHSSGTNSAHCILDTPQLITVGTQTFDPHCF